MADSDSLPPRSDPAAQPAQATPPQVTPPTVRGPAFPPPQAYPPPPEFSVGAAPVPTPAAFSAPDPTYAATPPPSYPSQSYPSQSYPSQSYPPPAYPSQPYPAAAPTTGYGGYGGYGVQPAIGYPIFAPQPKTNGMAIASLVVSIVGLVFLICYGVGGLIAPVGAILGHVARKQIRERQESGDGMALAGVIVGWIGTGLGLIVLAFIVVGIVLLINTPSTGSTYGTGLNAILSFR